MAHRLWEISGLSLRVSSREDLISGRAFLVVVIGYPSRPAHPKGKAGTVLIATPNRAISIVPIDGAHATIGEPLDQTNSAVLPRFLAAIDPPRIRIAFFNSKRRRVEGPPGVFTFYRDATELSMLTTSFDIDGNQVDHGRALWHWT
jgi:hypothetical protein